MALTANELDAGEYHYTVMEAVTVPGELLCFRPLEVSETAHPTSMHAFFAGVGAVRKIEGKRG